MKTLDYVDGDLGPSFDTTLLHADSTESRACSRNGGPALE